jgi:hypothetical protein
VHRVVLQHVGEVVGLEQVVDADDLDVAEILNGSTENHTSDTTKTVDTYFDSHDSLSSLKKRVRMTQPSISKNPSSGGQRTATNLELGVEMACRQPNIAEKTP